MTPPLIPRLAVYACGFPLSLIVQAEVIPSRLTGTRNGEKLLAYGM